MADYKLILVALPSLAYTLSYVAPWGEVVYNASFFGQDLMKELEQFLTEYPGQNSHLLVYGPKVYTENLAKRIDDAGLFDLVTLEQ